MTDIDPTLREQLCAWMDGELPPDQARFLQRRLDGDPALRAQWERWQLASACLRGQRVRAMPAALPAAVMAAVSRERRRQGPWPWLAATAAAVLVALLLPARPVHEAEHAVAAPALAAAKRVLPADDLVSPVQPSSVADFPLATQPGGRPWPRSPVLPGPQAMEGYLVGHNTLMAQDGLGGFMPYVDVVANGDATASAEDGDR